MGALGWGESPRNVWPGPGEFTLSCGDLRPRLSKKVPSRMADHQVSPAVTLGTRAWSTQ